MLFFRAVNEYMPGHDHHHYKDCCKDKPTGDVGNPVHIGSDTTHAYEYEERKHEKIYNNTKSSGLDIPR